MDKAIDAEGTGAAGGGIRPEEKKLLMRLRGLSGSGTYFVGVLVEDGRPVHVVICTQLLDAPERLGK